MKNIKQLALLAILIIGITACEKGNQETKTRTDIIGCWVDSKIENDSIWIYQRSSSLIEDASGYQFLENDTVIERTSGWCGTPPLSYYNIKSVYSLQDSNLTIYSPYDADLIIQDWRIVSIDATELKIIKRYSSIY